MASQTRNLSLLAHRCREAMAYGRRLELVLSTGASVFGHVAAIREDSNAKPGALQAKPNTRSHLLVVTDGGLETSLEQVVEIRSAG